MNNKFDCNKLKLGKYIAFNRKLNGLSQEDFAYLVGISPRSISNIENGYHYPSLLISYKINKLLNISLLDYISDLNEEPLFLFNALYEKYLHYLEAHDFYKSKNLFKKIDLLRKHIPVDTIYYKRFLFALSWNYLINKDYKNCFDHLNIAYNLKLPKSKLSKHLNYKILLLRESVSPNLAKNSDEFKKISRKSIKILKKVLIELKCNQYLTMEYLYAILVIEIENLNNYYVKEIIENLLKLSLKFNRLDIYYQVIFYRGLYKNYKCSPSFYNDIDESLMNLYLTKNNTLFKHDIQFLNNINLIKTY
jgi:DNA-binding helix-turn-helix protein